ncbi:MAG: methionine--tRNA ligase subunit beta [Candidatus Micrarchaeia archaeon]
MVYISYEEFKKLDLRVGKIIEAEIVAGSNNLIRLKVDLGTEERQIVAGIAQCYKPDGLIGKEIVVVANLEPKTIRGLESNGMLLAAGETVKDVALLTVDREVKPGMQVL